MAKYKKYDYSQGLLIPVNLDEQLIAHSDDSVHLFRGKPSTCSEAFCPGCRSVATLGLCYFPILLLIVKSERSFLMDSPFKLILCALCTSRSRIASAMVGSRIFSCQCSTGI